MSSLVNANLKPHDPLLRKLYVASSCLSRYHGQVIYSLQHPLPSGRRLIRELIQRVVILALAVFAYPLLGSLHLISRCITIITFFSHFHKLHRYYSADIHFLFNSSPKMLIDTLWKVERNAFPYVIVNATESSLQAILAHCPKELVTPLFQLKNERNETPFSLALEEGFGQINTTLKKLLIQHNPKQVLSYIFSIQGQRQLCPDDYEELFESFTPSAIRTTVLDLSRTEQQRLIQNHFMVHVGPYTNLVVLDALKRLSNNEKLAESYSSIIPLIAPQTLAVLALNNDTKKVVLSVLHYFTAIQLAAVIPVLGDQDFLTVVDQFKTRYLNSPITQQKKVDLNVIISCATAQQKVAYLKKVLGQKDWLPQNFQKWETISSEFRTRLDALKNIKEPSKLREGFQKLHTDFQEAKTYLIPREFHCPDITNLSFRESNATFEDLCQQRNAAISQNLAVLKKAFDELTVAITNGCFGDQNDKTVSEDNIDSITYEQLIDPILLPGSGENAKRVNRSTVAKLPQSRRNGILYIQNPFNRQWYPANAYK